MISVVPANTNIPSVSKAMEKPSLPSLDTSSTGMISNKRSIASCLMGKVQL